MCRDGNGVRVWRLGCDTPICHYVVGGQDNVDKQLAGQYSDVHFTNQTSEKTVLGICIGLLKD
jgi:hypothetical protein